MEANDTMAVNAKTFRKIAKMIRRLVDHIRKEKSLPEKLARESFDQIDDLAKEALYTPPRNCDTGKDAKTLLDDYISIKRFSSDNQIRALYDLALPVIDWLLAPSEEREGEGK